ncbi:MAG TPA: hypothetical protein PK344_18000 [Syntrophorhabdaceae bacterium]|nr:hypothetical protein [Syntrophorhabdaceae bacterium]
MKHIEPINKEGDSTHLHPRRIVLGKERVSGKKIPAPTGVRGRCGS